MILLPAVDILDGQAVRLQKGEFGTETVYDTDPLKAAARWVRAGARALHIVDLDGAREGTQHNLEHVRRMAEHLDVPLQLGGGLRSPAAVDAALGAGADRVVIGTAAYEDSDFLDRVLAAHGERVVVSVDARGGRVATSGWSEQTVIPVESAIERLLARGVRRFVYSSIERDGMLQGPDLAGARTVARAVRGEVLYSGGVSSLEDVRALSGLREDNLTGVIVGKALYEERFTVSQAQRALCT